MKQNVGASGEKSYDKKLDKDHSTTFIYPQHIYFFMFVCRLYSFEFFLHNYQFFFKVMGFTRRFASRLDSDNPLPNPEVSKAGNRS